MKPIIICDVDCTLYSYSEFIRTNVLYPKESFNALLSLGDRFPAVRRTWAAFENHIEERIEGLRNLATSHGEVLFLSAFPAEDYKKKTFDRLSIKLNSSFPHKKINYLQSNKDFEKVILTIGDRPNDKGISEAYKSKLVYLPIYRSIQKHTGESYTTRLLQTVKAELDS
jgi:hypothetical protein